MTSNVLKTSEVFASAFEIVPHTIERLSLPNNGFSNFNHITIMTKLKQLLPCLSLLVLINCKTSQLKQAAIPQTGMFKVEILYPNGEDKTFDMDYYEKTHMPMVAGFLGKNVRFYEIDKGIAGRTPGDKIPFVAIGSFYITDVAEYNKAIVQNRDAIVNDIKKYTNIQPVIQISEIKNLGYNSIK